MTAERIEHDSLGEVAVPAERYWGAQTQRSLDNFPIGTETMPKPVMIHTLLQSIRLLADASRSFANRCVAGIEADEARIAQLVGQSLMLVTALAPHVGYNNAAKIATTAHETGSSLKEAALTLGMVSEDQFDAWVRPDEMIGPKD